MHPELSELIALRDGGPVGADVLRHVERCTDCTVRLAGLRNIRDALRELPLVLPPEQAWERIRAARELETGAPPDRRPLRLAAGIAVAAATAVFSLSLLRTLPPDEGPVADVSPVSADVSGLPQVTLIGLQDESRQLENMLQALGPRRDTMTLRTASAIGELEDGIAWIDYTLANARVTDDERKALWLQRVELLESLLTVRAAHAGSI